MSDNFNDGLTRRLVKKMNEFERMIDDIESGIRSLDKNEQAIIEYLSDIKCSMPLGMSLRRYLCGKFSNAYDEELRKFKFVLYDGREIYVSDYRNDNYDICKDDVAEYTEIFMDIDKHFNTDENGDVVTDISRAEARRLLKVTTACIREKMFLLSFALHMDSEDVHKFLTDVLAEQTYNFRNPDEIIAYYCHTNEEVNNYVQFLSIKEAYEKLSDVTLIKDNLIRNYTQYARNFVNNDLENENDLMKFLIENRTNFYKLPETAYSEFMDLYELAMSRSYTQNPNSYELYPVQNTEQLAKCMLQFIPRATSKKENKTGKKVVTNDFIPIYNGERGQESRKVQTTTLPKEITMNLLVKDRIDDLINRIKPVTRKDLVFMKFYNLYLDIQEDVYELDDNINEIFVDECNEMLFSCGMSRLYPANRFENLIMISLASENPFEMFEDIIEESFMNEPTFDDGE